MHFTKGISGHLIIVGKRYPHRFNWGETGTGIILWMRPANELRRYIVTSSLNWWAHAQNDPCGTRLDLLFSFRTWNIWPFWIYVRHFLCIWAVGKSQTELALSRLWEILRKDILCDNIPPPPPPNHTHTLRYVLTRMGFGIIFRTFSVPWIQPILHLDFVLLSLAYFDVKVLILWTAAPLNCSCT